MWFGGPQKTKAAAEAALSSGDVDKAIAQYEKLLKKTPGDLKVRKQLGDLHRQQGDTGAAIAHYMALADATAQQGLFLRALSACRLVLELDADHAGARQVLQSLEAHRQAGVAQVQQYTDFAADDVSIDVDDADLVVDAATATGDDMAIEVDLDMSTSGEGGTIDVDVDDVLVAASAPPLPVAAMPGAVDDGKSHLALSDDDDGEEHDLDLAGVGFGDDADDKPAAGAATSSGVFDDIGEWSVDFDALVDDTTADVPGAIEDAAFDAFGADAFGADAFSMGAADDNEAGHDAEESFAGLLDDDDGTENGENDSADSLDEALAAFAEAPAQASAPSKRAVSQPNKRMPIPLLFRDIPQEAFFDLLGELTLWEVNDGQQIVTQGELGESCFIVSSGRVRVERVLPDGDVQTVCHLHEGDLFGEIAMLVRSQRTASVIAEGYVEVFEVHRNVIDDLVLRFPEVRESMARFSRARAVQNVLKGSPLFRGLPHDVHQQIAAAFETRSAKAGEDVIQQFEDGAGLFVILAGSVEVNIDDNQVQTLGVGDVFGEMSLYFDEVANATVRTTSHCQFLFLDAVTFQQWRATIPQLQGLLETLCEERDAQNADRKS